jgi:hypothetical protein
VNKHFQDLQAVYVNTGITKAPSDEEIDDAVEFLQSLGCVLKLHPRGLFHATYRGRHLGLFAIQGAPTYYWSYVLHDLAVRMARIETINPSKTRLPA